MSGFVRSSTDGGPGPNAAPTTKTPLMMLKEFLPNLAFVITEREEMKAPVFLAETTVKGMVYVAKASTKKIAKGRVAEQILTQLYGMDFTAAHEAAAAATASSAAQIPVMDEEAQKLAERVMVLVMERFYSLTNMGLANTAKRKVLAGIVMTLKEVSARRIKKRICFPYIGTRVEGVNLVRRKRLYCVSLGSWVRGQLAIA